MCYVFGIELNRSSQLFVSLWVSHVGNAQYTGDSYDRLSAGLSELRRHALTLLSRVYLDLCMIPTFYYQKVSCPFTPPRNWDDLGVFRAVG